MEINECVIGEDTTIEIIKNHKDDVDCEENAKKIYDWLRHNISAKTYEILGEMIEKNTRKNEPFNSYLKERVEKMELEQQEDE